MEIKTWRERCDTKEFDHLHVIPPDDIQRIMQSEIDELRAALDTTMKALTTIAGGWTNRFPGAPDPMTTESPLHFRSDMWLWSQKVAKAALAAEGEKHECF